MEGSTHRSAGIAISLITLQPSTVPQCIATIVGGTIGGTISDIDVKSSVKAGKYKWQDIVSDIVLVIIMLIIDYFYGDGICEAFISSLNKMTSIPILIFLIACIYGYNSSHRSFMHSIFCCVLLSVCMFYICKPLVAPFAIGFASHIILDLTNKKPVQILWPIKKNQTGF